MSISSEVDLAPRTVWERFEEAAQNECALTILDGTPPYSVATLVEMASRGGASLRGKGLGPGQRVGALATTSYDFVLSMMSTWAAGATFVSLPPPPLIGNADAWRKGLARRVSKAKLDALVLSDRELGLNVGAQEVPITEMLSGRKSAAARVDPGSPALIQFSSGTTSAPRAVRVSHAALTAQFDAIYERMRLGAPRRMVSWLPLFHDLGLIGYLLLPLSRAEDVALIPTTSFLRDPLIWLREISARQATSSPAPNFAYGMVAKILEQAPRQDLDLSSWAHAASGGEMIDASTLARFARAAEPYGFRSEALLAGYGLAEATCIVSMRAPLTGIRTDSIDRAELGRGRAIPTEPSDLTATFVSTGRPMPGCEVAILRDGDIVGDREVGEILFRGPCVMDGYDDDPGATENAFWNGWLRTGDLGYLCDGEVYVTGRRKDVLVVKGENVHPEDLERLLLGVPGLRPGCAVALGEDEGKADETIVIVAETKLDDPAELDRCRKEVTRRVWRATGFSPRVLLAPPGSVAKTSSGKLRRAETRSRLLSGTIRVS